MLARRQELLPLVVDTFTAFDLRALENALKGR
mgnify:CR=1 FL=1